MDIIYDLTPPTIGGGPGEVRPIRDVFLNGFFNFFHMKKICHPREGDCVAITKWTLIHPVMPDPDPASRVVTHRKTTGFRVKPGMTKICIGISLNYHNYLE